MLLNAIIHNSMIIDWSMQTIREQTIWNSASFWHKVL
jgi:hypothetical protein